MKRSHSWLLPLIIFSSVLLPSQLVHPTIIEAKSGCCSGHGGVNCAVGPQSNGAVICNDGWRGSSCAYSEMVMCGGSTSATTRPVATLAPTPRPTPVPTVKPTVAPTLPPTNTPTVMPTSTSEVQAATTYVPQPSPTPDTQGQAESMTIKKPEAGLGSVIFGFALFVAIVSVPVILLKKLFGVVRRRF